MSKLSNFVEKFKMYLFGEKNLEISRLTKELIEFKAYNNQLNKQVAVLRNQIPLKNPKEDEINNKYPKINMNYLRHETDGDYHIDIRNFFSLNDSSIPTVIGNSDDEKALNSLNWVMDNIRYTSDDSDNTYKNSEYWAYAYQTLRHRRGDCEDGAILLSNIMVKSGIPYWKVRLTAGNVTNGGHAYVTYYCESKNKWVILDWCYWPNRKNIEDRSDYKDEANYKDVWFSWNTKYCFSKGTKDDASAYLK